MRTVEKTRERLLGHPAPRDLSFAAFTTMWEDLADRVENESGDRLAVDYAGHRVVFRREQSRTSSVLAICSEPARTRSRTAGRPGCSS